MVLSCFNCNMLDVGWWTNLFWNPASPKKILICKKTWIQCLQFFHSIFSIFFIHSCSAFNSDFVANAAIYFSKSEFFVSTEISDLLTNSLPFIFASSISLKIYYSQKQQQILYHNLLFYKIIHVWCFIFNIINSSSSS